MAEDQPGVDFYVEELARSAQALSVLLEEDPGTREILIGYTKYLLGEKPRSYNALASYLDYYGAKYVFPDIEYLLQGTSYKFIVELGPGTGWLISKLGVYASWGGSRYAIDKRDNLFIPRPNVKFIEMDLEVSSYFLNTTPVESLIVANQFLHCVDNWKEIIEKNRAPWIVSEVSSLVWRQQMKKFGATPLSTRDLRDGFHEARYALMGQRGNSVVHTTFWRPL